MISRRIPMATGASCSKCFAPMRADQNSARASLARCGIERGARSMLYPHSEATLAVLRRAPVIPVLTVKDVEDELAQARALIAGGLLVLEITLRTPAAMGAVPVLAKTFPDACIGAGTIVEADQIEAAANAGAGVLVS